MAALIPGVALALLLVGCAASPDREDPVAVSQAFVDALAAQDSEGACDQATRTDEDTREVCEQSVAGFVADLTDDELSAYAEVEIESVFPSSGGAAAYVSSAEYSAASPESARLPLALTLAEGEWSVDLDSLG